MEAILIEASKQVPGLIVLAWICATFLRTIRDERVANRQMDVERSEALKTLGDTCHEFQRDLVRKNEIVLDRVSGVVECNTEMLGRVAERLK